MPVVTMSRYGSRSGRSESVTDCNQLNTSAVRFSADLSDSSTVYARAYSVLFLLGHSVVGRTSVFDPEGGGSNPSAPVSMND